MGFPAEERLAMLALKGVGPTVVARLEQLGFRSLADLRGADVVEITRRASELVGSTCWRNSPQARAAIAAVVSLADQRHIEPSNSV
jgi:nucleotidyltransferase/DNA polymerase involved in DNA repair